ncbi:DUF4233 domain-containing protein [Pseudoclavibacter soli]|uniref:DUF4233 domain-containing protein n=1 Tax=Pseudoclavibacter soli TaxID=452623 RepID=UPI0004280889|nr:DUF4233 domain-containing protein [Pseudoclavibacter soli]
MSGASTWPKTSGDRLRSKLAGIMLGFEVFVVIFITLFAFGMQLIASPAVWWLGAAVLVLVIAALALTRRSRAGLMLGWLVQVVLLAAGLLNFGILIVALVFVAMWIYVFVAGARADQAERDGAQ